MNVIPRCICNISMNHTNIRLYYYNPSMRLHPNPTMRTRRMWALLVGFFLLLSCCSITSVDGIRSAEAWILPTSPSPRHRQQQHGPHRKNRLLPKIASTFEFPTRSLPLLLRAKDNNDWNENAQSGHSISSTSRRTLLQQSITTSSAILILLLQSPAISHASPTTTDQQQPLFQRQTDKFTYQIATDDRFQETQKPVKTHLDEVNLVSIDLTGYQYGITVDPVKITSLKEFGTPEQVAARVVTAEVNRDGVFEVTLLEDPYESNDGAYILHYLSIGKRGNKHLINKIFITRQLLFVLTAQVKEGDYEAQKEEMKRIVSSFTIV